MTNIKTYLLNNVMFMINVIYGGLNNYGIDYKIIRTYYKFELKKFTIYKKIVCVSRVFGRLLRVSAGRQWQP